MRFQETVWQLSRRLRTLSSSTSPQGAPLRMVAAVWRWRVTMAIGLVTAVYAAQFALLTPPEAKAAYSISASARLNDDDSAYLSRTFSSTSNRKTWTYSAWIKLGNLDITYRPLLAYSTSAFGIGGASAQSNNLYFNQAGVWSGYTQGVFRDPAKWYHVVFQYDTTQATAADRVRIYVDGVQQTLTTEGGSLPSQNSDGPWNQNTAHTIGWNSGWNYFDGYLSDVYFIDGQALDPTSFGETDANGYWRPKAYSGSYGTNGFHLDFSNSGSLGADTSGNGNAWTPANLDSTDQVIDTPTNSFATLNPLSLSASVGTLSQGNLKFVRSGSGFAQAYSSQNISSGKWYAEFTLTNTIQNGGLGFIYNLNATGFAQEAANKFIAQGTAILDGVTYFPEGQTFQKDGSATDVGAGNDSAGDLFMLAIDADTGDLWWGKNCVWFRGTNGTPSALTGGDPTDASTAVYTNVPGSFYMAVDSELDRAHWGANFGQLRYGTSTATAYTHNSSTGGYFMCTPPTGYKALSTKSLPKPAITVPRQYFDAKLYTGNGSTQSITSLLFQPSLIWLKDRTGANSHGLFDSQRGKTIVIYTSVGTTNWTAPTGVTSVEYLVVAGGGGGGFGNGGGGGAGGVRTGTLSVTPSQSYTVTVGAGGSGGVAAVPTAAANGSNSVFATITSTGGGAGGSPNQTGSCGSNGGSNGGSGGGGSRNVSGCAGTGTGGQGNNGGSGVDGSPERGGGGGGAGAAGASGTDSGNGGVGVVSSITGAATYYGGGGGGGARLNFPTPGTGGTGGGGNGSVSTAGSAGAANTGGGGGAGGQNASSGSGNYQNGGSGGSGIVVLSYAVSSGASVFPYLSSNNTAAETSNINALTAFLADGFSLGSAAAFNTNTNAYVAWAWKASPLSGFDIVAYTGDNTSNRAVSHALATAPEFALVKRRDSTGDWFAWHQGLSGAAYFLKLNATDAQANSNSPWGTGSWAATTFMVTNNGTNNANANGASYVAYLFAEKDGFSKFGSYTGNGSADGPFVYTGFKPRYVMIKDVTLAGADWHVSDSARDTYNPVSGLLRPDTSGAETTTAWIDLLSNGFKLRFANGAVNNTSDQYIYAAFADIPFKYSAASAASASSFVQAVAFMIGMEI